MAHKSNYGGRKPSQMERKTAQEEHKMPKMDKNPMMSMQSRMHKDMRKMK